LPGGPLGGTFCPMRKGRGSHPRRRPSPGGPRWLWLVALAATGGCEPAPEPVLGAASSTDFLRATRFALAEDVREFGAMPSLDTLLIPQGSGRAAQALDAAHRLAAVPGMVAVLGHANSAASLASSQVYNRARIVQIAPTSTASLYSEAGRYSFRMVPADEVQGRFLAEAVHEHLPVGGTIALLFVNDDYGRNLRRTFLEALEPERAEVVLDLPHAESDVQGVDVPHHLGALEHEGPDLIVWLGRVPALNELLPGIRMHLGEIPILGSDALARADLLSDRAPEWDGVRFSDFLDMEETPELRAFGERWESVLGVEAGAGEALTYDATRMLLAGLRDGARTGEAMRMWLMTLGRERPPYPGITGPIQFDERGDVERTFVVRTIRPRARP
jgi:branched-chain amino acid transport system substrate-binding protein